MKSRIAVYFCILLSFAVQSAFATSGSSKDDAVISELYKTIAAAHSSDMSTRVAAISEYFMGKPYLLGALGDGPDSQFDQNPLYRIDAFDCETFVSTVIALAHADNLTQFRQQINAVRYRNAIPNYFQRNHFMSVDWNINNNHKGYIKDITNRFTDSNGKPIAAVANAIINKPAWYQHKTIADIRSLTPISDQQLQQKLAQLKQLGMQQAQQRGKTLYLPLKNLFSASGQPNQFIFKQIPSGSVIEIVRPNWHLETKIGTALNVSHVGLAIRTQQGLMFRQASSTQKKVIDVPLVDYLKSYLSSPTVKGINVQLVTGLGAS